MRERERDINYQTGRERMPKRGNGRKKKRKKEKENGRRKNIVQG